MTVQVFDVVRIVAEMLFDGVDIMQNVYHFQHQGSVQSTDLNFLERSGDFIEAAMVDLQPLMTDNISFGTISGFNVTQDTPLFGIDWPTFTTGDGIDNTLPLQCAALASFPTGTAKRIGKKFMAGFGEDNQAGGGELSVTLTDAMVTFGVELLAGWVQGTLILGNGTYDPVTEIFRQFVAATVDAIMRTQRRRVVGVGV